MKQKIKLRHRILAGILAIAMLIVAVPVLGLSSVDPVTLNRVADASTMDHWKQYFGSQVLSTANAGGIWTDKSVFTNASAFGGLISMDDPNNNFLVALSAIASNKSIVGYSHIPTDTMLALGGERYPIAFNYLRTMLCIDLMCLRRVEEAKKNFSELWETVKKDDGIELIGEHYLLMLGLPDICLKRQKPDDFKQLLAVTKRFGQSWRKMQEQVFKKYHAQGLTVTEFNIASLYNRGWAVKEIALHMDISERMVKHHIAMIYEKLHIGNRTELSKHLLS